MSHVECHTSERCPRQDIHRFVADSATVQDACKVRSEVCVRPHRFDTSCVTWQTVLQNSQHASDYESPLTVFPSFNLATLRLALTMHDTAEIAPFCLGEDKPDLTFDRGKSTEQMYLISNEYPVTRTRSRCGRGGVHT